MVQAQQLIMGKPKMVQPKRGDIVVINFDPTIGSEIKKTRPAIIIQNDIGNLHSPITIVAAVSSQFTKPLYPTEVFIPENEGGLNADSVILLNQIRSIDKTRIIQRLGRVSTLTQQAVDRAICLSLDIQQVGN